ncbi:MAG TPA: DUF167 domain-containing protein [Gaiellaceae bacterium]|nr:DUF167 domain-containing protein [Gaiellaceae bacterium]
MESTRLRLRVVPGASRNPGIVGRYGQGWKIRVAAPPERGAANRAVLALLAETLGVPKAAVRLVSGPGSRDKIVEVAGMGSAETDARLASAEREDA